jgi:phosphoesterase RecJ-like protein
MRQIINQLKSKHHILIASHVQPDGDALGSLIATGLALTAAGKKTTLFNEDQIPKAFGFLPSVDKITHQIESADNYEVAIILDSGDLQRVGEAASAIGQIPVIINIDHHITNTGFGTHQLIDPVACATSEIIYRLIKEMGIVLTRAMAFSIYTGIMTDTGSFRFSNTNREAFSICEEMVGLGVDPNFVANHVSVTYSLSRIKLLNMVLDSIEVSKNGRLSLMALTQEMLEKTHTKPDELGRLINYARHIENVKVAALIFENGNGSLAAPSPEKRFHISLRSDGSVDVAEIATMYGGGGHKNAAGFNITATLQDIKAKILNLANDL